MIPVWPGANSHRGVFGVYDLADLYFYDSKIEEFGRSFYNNFFTETSVYNFARFCQQGSGIPYDIQDYLSMDREEYRRFLNHIVQVIQDRNNQFPSTNL
ncbi:hypothetical protein [Streptococcus dysgalactiae]|uniref:hypothetical protein n=1 Tax=Streptococcus dysgalactiae TaxID=1334 RepID=UPI0010FD6ACC